MDEKTAVLLESWGFSQLIETFKAQEIDFEGLLLLTSEILKEFIPVVGIRIKLLNKINILKASLPQSEDLKIATDEHETESIEVFNSLQNILDTHGESSKSLTSAEEVTLCDQKLDFDIYDLLSKSNVGAFVRTIYKKENTLNRQARKKLVEIVVNEVINRRRDSHKVYNHEWESLATRIVQAFPNEEAATYYVAPLTEGPNQKISKGKLVDRFRNNLRVLRTAGLLPKKRKFHEESSQTLVITEELQQHVTWLKHNKEPWSEVLVHWKESSGLRTKAKNSSVHDFIAEWPVLKQPQGYTLLESDFNFLYPDKELCLFTEFNDLCLALIDQNKITAQQTPYFAVATDSDVPQDCRDAVMLMLLPMLCPPKTRINIAQSKPKNHWKPSIIESQEGFILHLKATNDIKPAIDRKRNKMCEMGLTVQPFIIFVSESLRHSPQCYLSIDDLLYTLPSPLKAVDICFKAIHALNASYAPECLQIWMLLQLGVYHIVTKFDKQIPSVNSLLSTLKKIKSE